MSPSMTNLRIVGPFVLTSALLLALCGAGAGYLYKVQASTAADLWENVYSRRAALDMEDALKALIADHEDEVKASAIRDRLPALLTDIVHHAQRPMEKELLARIQ